MLIVGLTGGIASGKSTISAFYQQKGIPVIDADILARQVVEPGRRAYKKIIKEFGEQVKNQDGTLNREKLGSIIFQDAAKRRLLNQCTHPFIRLETIWLLVKYWIQGEKLVVLDFPLLYESGLNQWVHTTIVVFW
jgi:dephospho-CoA kinase